MRSEWAVDYEAALSVGAELLRASIRQPVGARNAKAARSQPAPLCKRFRAFGTVRETHPGAPRQEAHRYRLAKVLASRVGRTLRNFRNLGKRCPPRTRP